MVFEVLSKMIKKEEMCFISDFGVGLGGVFVSHLQIADDTMILVCGCEIIRVS